MKNRSIFLLILLCMVVTFGRAAAPDSLPLRPAPQPMLGLSSDDKDLEDYLQYG